LNLGDVSGTTASGIGNLAVNQGTNNVVAAVGNFNRALQIGGANNTVTAFGGTPATILNPFAGGATTAFSLFGNNNTVTAGPGLVATAGVLGKSGVTVTQTTTGIKIG
jgi:hypothetical protein